MSKLAADILRQPMLNLVILDSREPESIRMLNYGVTTITQELKAGDAWLVTDDLNGTPVVVERKTLPDLLASIADERLYNQVAVMHEVSPWAYVVVTEWPVVVEGYMFVNDTATKWDWPRVQGALLTIQDLGAELLFGWRGAEDYPAILRTLANRNHGELRLRPRRPSAQMSRAEQVLASLPGIAEGRAKALIDHCGSVADALTFLTTGGGGQVPGVGPATREAVRQALGMRDGCGLWQVPDSDSKELEK